ncbi:MAG: glycosyltransferase family 4 protein [Actinomycetota bacterium]
MQILLLTHYFEPENGAPQRRWSALIERLVAQGHSVHVIAPAPHYPTGRSPEQMRPELRPGASSVGEHGATVHRVSFLSHNSSIVSRTADHVWVARRSVRVAMRLVKAGRLQPDVVIATAPGLPTLAAGRAVSRRLGIPFVAEMRDAWPDLVSHTPGLADGRGLVGRVKQSVHEAVTGLQRGAATVVTTTESFARVLRGRGIDSVHVIRNGTLLERYASIPATVHDHDELRVLYMGTIGRSQGLEHLIRAAAIAQDRGLPVDTRIVGYGADLKNLRELNASLGSPVDLRGKVGADEVFGHYVWADTTVVSLRAWEPFEWTVPSKLYELMATGKHVSAIVAGEAADLVLESGCGDVVAPGSVEAIVALWERLVADRQLVSSRGDGRAWVAANVDYDILAERYRFVLEDAIRLTR